MYENNNYYEYNSAEGNYGAAPNTNGQMETVLQSNIKRCRALSENSV